MEERICHSYSAIPTRLDFLRDSAGTKGFDKKKKDWKPVDISFSPAARQHILQSFYKELCFHGIEFSNFLVQRCSSDPLDKYSLQPSATGP